jgi:hypothetical protein
MTPQEVIILVKRRFERRYGERVHIMTARPEGDHGWAVFVEYDGIIWKQSVSQDGRLGSCTRQYPQLEMVAH